MLYVNKYYTKQVTAMLRTNNPFWSTWKMFTQPECSKPLAGIILHMLQIVCHILILKYCLINKTTIRYVICCM